jgi:hypothetical protein
MEREGEEEREVGEERVYILMERERERGTPNERERGRESV